MDHFYHWGVPGMKWGRRKPKEQRISSRDHDVSSAIRKKRLHEMSNEEIQILSKRIELEKKYHELNPGKIAKGKKAVNATISGLGKLTLAMTTVTGLVVAGQKLYKQIPKGSKIPRPGSPGLPIPTKIYL